MEQIRASLQTFDDYGLSERIDFAAEIRPGGQAVLKVTVTFIDTSELHIREFLVVQGTVQPLSYAYQYQKQDGTLIFRYDNAKHRPPLSFDEHKHDSNGNIVSASFPPIDALVLEIVDTITR